MHNVKFDTDMLTFYLISLWLSLFWLLCRYVCLTKIKVCSVENWERIENNNVNNTLLFPSLSHIFLLGEPTLFLGLQASWKTCNTHIHTVKVNSEELTFWIISLCLSLCRLFFRYVGLHA